MGPGIIIIIIIIIISPQGDNDELRPPRRHPQQPQFRYIGMNKKRDL